VGGGRRSRGLSSVPTGGLWGRAHRCECVPLHRSPVFFVFMSLNNTAHLSRLVALLPVASSSRRADTKPHRATCGLARTCALCGPTSAWQHACSLTTAQAPPAASNDCVRLVVRRTLTRTIRIRWRPQARRQDGAALGGAQRARGGGALPSVGGGSDSGRSHRRRHHATAPGVLWRSHGAGADAGAGA